MLQCPAINWWLVVLFSGLSPNIFLGLVGLALQVLHFGTPNYWQFPQCPGWSWLVSWDDISRSYCCRWYHSKRLNPVCWKGSLEIIIDYESFFQTPPNRSIHDFKDDPQQFLIIKGNSGKKFCDSYSCYIHSHYLTSLTTIPHNKPRSFKLQYLIFACSYSHQHVICLCWKVYCPNPSGFAWQCTYHRMRLILTVLDLHHCRGPSPCVRH